MCQTIIIGTRQILYLDVKFLCYFTHKNVKLTSTEDKRKPPILHKIFTGGEKSREYFVAFLKAPMPNDTCYSNDPKISTPNSIN